ncbi:MAG: hypothetical protein QXM16_09140, partial [Nitrososphaerota archaeon]
TSCLRQRFDTLTRPRLSVNGVDKLISTQMGQNISSFRVEDVDLERLRNIMGSDIAYSARYLPKCYCIYKGHALKIQRSVIMEVDKLGGRG